LAVAGAAAAPAQADGITPIDLFPGDIFGYALGLSGDGSTIIGRSGPGYSNYSGFRWTTADGLVSASPGGTSWSSALGVSDDGTVILGSSDLGQFIWTAGGGYTFFDPDLLHGGSFDNMSGDGLTFVGDVYGNGHAASWTLAGGVVDLGLPIVGGTLTSSSSASYDGSVITGYAFDPSHYTHVWRWSAGDGMTVLDTPDGFTDSTNPVVSADGSTIAATSFTFTDGYHAVWTRWTQATGTVLLGAFSGMSSTSVAAVNADGSVIVGGGYSPGTGISSALRWSEQTGILRVDDLLRAADVDLTGLNLTYARGISADGHVIAGEGTYDDETPFLWLAVCESDRCRGLFSPEDFMASFGGVGVVGKNTSTFMGNFLSTLQDIATQHKKGGSPWSWFGSGFYDSDPVGGANVGFTYDLGADRLVGASLGESYIETPMTFDGVSRVWGTTLGGFVAQQPDAGFEWFAGLSASTLKGSNDRQYLNGASIDSSKGPVTGYGLGVQLKAGYAVPVSEAFRVTPFASLTLTKSHLDAYIEDSGPLPARFDASDNTAQTLRLGSDARWSFSPDTWAYGSLAFAHRTDDAKSSGVSGFLIGAFAVTTPPAQSMRNWGEATVGMRLPLAEGAALTGSVTATMPGSDYETSLQARVGVSLAF
tara:strand:+ start:3847 stop:5793 length:1947 start_codon:yes stop_codon:yes gene_type:complete